MNDTEAKFDQKAWIAAAREATGAKEIVLHKLPLWAYRALQKKCGGRSAYEVENTLLNGKPWSRCKLLRLFDHWGTSEVSCVHYKGKALVAEPYTHDREIAEDALAFADWLGCGVLIGGPSWWFPGSTTRVEFYPLVKKE